jgi:hypothetical protein
VGAAAVSVTVVNSTIFGAGSATAALYLIPSDIAPTIITQTDDSPVLVGVGIAIRNLAASGVRPSVTMDGSLLDVGTITYTPALYLRGVGALGVAVWWIRRRRVAST